MRFLFLSHAGSFKPTLTLLRRSEQTGIISKGFSVRWTAAVLLLGSVGAAWALNPVSRDSKPLEVPQTGAKAVVVEGEAQVVAPLLGSLLGEVALSAHDRELMSKAKSQRLVLRAKPVVDFEGKKLRERAAFLRTVEEVEEQYVLSGAYPALPPEGAAGKMSYRTDGQDFTLGSGHRRYTAEEGLTFGASPVKGTAFEVAGLLASQESGWGPWRGLTTVLQPQKGVSDTEALAFLSEDVPDSKSTARMFFPVDRTTSGYLFRKKDGSSIYQNGELTYDAAVGTFSLKLFRTGEAASPSLRADRLEAEAKARDGATVFVGDQGLLSDLGLAEGASKGGNGVVVLASAASLTCSVSSALDGLRLATLARHQESLSPGLFLGGEEKGSQAVVVGRVELLDNLGQLHQLHLRAGRGVDYDWVLGQVCPVGDEARAEHFVDSGNLSEEPVSQEPPLVKAGN